MPRYEDTDVARTITNLGDWWVEDGGPLPEVTGGSSTVSLST
jgi:hypothetical protein